MFRLEMVPLVLGALVALLGLGLVADGWLPDGTVVRTERRRRVRAERDRGGEVTIGIGVICLGAALIGRDTWRFGTVAVMAGTVLILVGAVMNGRYLRERIAFRGASRRSDLGAPQAPHVDRAYPQSTGEPAGPAEPPASGRPANPLRAEPQERRKQPR